ncbi:exopolysaccharide biosynthesis polyprenyl glycosylphosphotransferase [Flavobacterium sp.]|uniref:exopolysaccharide biosynthesis polyprenyl glycosylphosphotransferase n=1 Tax=Flavobacterium sp. TaxID=239 RepID=UPI002B4B1717|nr:exopolysaccharide biosynthesis polyprenyl glycosylphosphotransferase [Flavobacterium sp.]HLF52421.1 exopolysaccharide biosynthesis polyprenyl glycosylphosphotransferase [Flavobacterium sp.]
MLSQKKIHFEISERKILLRVFDVLFVFMALYIVGIVFDFGYLEMTKDNYYWVIVLGFYITLFGAVFEMYNLQIASNQFQIIKSIILTSSTTVLFYLLTPYYTPVLPSNRLQIIYFFIAILLALFIWRMLYLNFFASHRFIKKVILVCDCDQAEELITGLESADPHYKIMGYIDSDKESGKTCGYNNIKNIALEDLDEFVQKNHISELVIASQDTEGITVLLYNKLLHLLENGFVIREYTQVYESSTHRIPVQYVARDFYRYFPFSRNNQNKLYLLGVRVMECLISVIGLSVGIALIPFILIGNFLGSKGPLFYTQERVGKNGVVFKIFKFRTMVQNAETAGAVFAVQNDMRITPFGKFLRKARLDEFPQFINILNGDMAVIGPRPERPFFVAAIAEVMPFYETRHVIRPGLTGWAQVNYSYGETIDESLIKLQYDLYYIKHRSIFLDVNIVVKTVSTVLFYRGQ